MPARPKPAQNPDTRSRDIIRNLFARLLHDEQGSEPSDAVAAGPGPGHGALCEDDLLFDNDPFDNDPFGGDPFADDPFGIETTYEQADIDEGSILHADPLLLGPVGDVSAEPDPFGNALADGFGDLEGDGGGVREGLLGDGQAGHAGHGFGGGIGRASGPASAGGDGIGSPARFRLSEGAALSPSGPVPVGAPSGLEVTEAEVEASPGHAVRAHAVALDQSSLGCLPERPATGTHRVARIGLGDITQLNDVLCRGWRVIQMLGCGDGGFVVALRYAGYAA